MARWRLIDTPPARGAWNMAVDEALLESVASGAPPVLRFYRWRPACLSFGRHQPARGRFDEERVRRAGIDVVRRPTGGEAVLHHRELTYAALFPADLLGGARAAYGAVHRALAAGLARLGVTAEVAGVRRNGAVRPAAGPCFRAAGEGEILVRGRKLVGSAVRRRGPALLQHGSLLLHDDQGSIPGLLHGLPADPPVVATLSALLDPLPPWEALTGALVAGWTATLGGGTTHVPLTPAELERADRLAGRYRDPAWTWHGRSGFSPSTPGEM